VTEISADNVVARAGPQLEPESAVFVCSVVHQGVAVGHEDVEALKLVFVGDISVEQVLTGRLRKQETIHVSVRRVPRSAVAVRVANEQKTLISVRVCKVADKIVFHGTVNEDSNTVSCGDIGDYHIVVRVIADTDPGISSLFLNCVLLNQTLCGSCYCNPISAEYATVGTNGIARDQVRNPTIEVYPVCAIADDPVVLVSAVVTIDGIDAVHTKRRHFASLDRDTGTEPDLDAAIEPLNSGAGHRSICTIKRDVVSFDEHVTEVILG